MEKKDQNGTKWQKAVEIIGNKHEATVPDLVEGMKYQFRVRAVNKAGQSKPSEASESITAKDRFSKWLPAAILHASHYEVSRASSIPSTSVVV